MEVATRPTPKPAAPPINIPFGPATQPPITTPPRVHPAVIPPPCFSNFKAISPVLSALKNSDVRSLRAANVSVRVKANISLNSFSVTAYEPTDLLPWVADINTYKILHKYTVNGTTTKKNTITVENTKIA